MLAVAEKWFSFSRGVRLTVKIANGISFVNECISGKQKGTSVVMSTVIITHLLCVLLTGLFDVIVLDVDSKDMSCGVSSPPETFLEKQFLSNVKLLLKDSGTSTCVTLLIYVANTCTQ